MALYLMVEVDTNDGDYDDKSTIIEDINSEELVKFKEYLKILPHVDRYHYNSDGVKVVTGNIIRFDNNVGYDSINQSCGLKDLLISNAEFEEEDYTEQEILDEGMITEDQYDVLVKYLPIYIEGGFHSIIRVWFETREAPILIEEVTL